MLLFAEQLMEKMCHQVQPFKDNEMSYVPFLESNNKR